MIKPRFFCFGAQVDLIEMIFPKLRRRCFLVAFIFVYVTNLADFSGTDSLSDLFVFLSFYLRFNLNYGVFEFFV